MVTSAMAATSRRSGAADRTTGVSCAAARDRAHATGRMAVTNMADDPVELLAGIASTRAIRRYRDEPVPTDALATMMFAATRAPSGSNRQPFRFLVLRDGPKALEAKRLIGESARSIWGGKREADG